MGTILTISVSTCEPVSMESEIVRVISRSTTAISEKIRLKILSSGYGYLKNDSEGTQCHLENNLYMFLIFFTTFSKTHSEHLGQSLNQASDVCRRSNMLRKLTCIAGSSYSSAALNEIIS